MSVGVSTVSIPFTWALNSTIKTWASNVIAYSCGGDSRFGPPTVWKPSNWEKSHVICSKVFIHCTPKMMSDPCCRIYKSIIMHKGPIIMHTCSLLPQHLISVPSATHTLNPLDLVKICTVYRAAVFVMKLCVLPESIKMLTMAFLVHPWCRIVSACTSPVSGLREASIGLVSSSIVGSWYSSSLQTS